MTIMSIYNKLLDSNNNGRLYKNVSLANDKLIKLTLITTENDADVTIENINNRLALTDGNETYNGSTFDTELLEDSSDFFYDKVSDEITEDNVIECLNDMKSYIENVSLDYEDVM